MKGIHKQSNQPNYAGSSTNYNPTENAIGVCGDRSE